MDIRLPDSKWLISEGKRVECSNSVGQIGLSISKGVLLTQFVNNEVPVSFVCLRWVFRCNEMPTGQVKVLGDDWERAYGDMEWRSIDADRFMPWYFAVTNEKRTCLYGVRTCPASLCHWTMDNDGVTLWCDVRNGGKGIKLGGRSICTAEIVFGDYSGATAFEAIERFCGKMAVNPIFPSEPVYGSNNWYYAYGNSSHDEILQDARIAAEYTQGLENRPFMVIDDGWQPHRIEAPWDRGNEKFPDMARLASEMTELGVKPGIWIRYLTDHYRECGGKDSWRQLRDSSKLDPSHPEVLEYVAECTKRLVSWGYKLIKHDYSTIDIFGGWGFERKKTMAGMDADWSFYDTTKTSAEIIIEFYRTIKDNAGDAVIIGCNTMSHLCVGLAHINRTGDDTSGKDWDRTRKFGVNTLAFRQAQNRKFYMADADCVGITELVPWEKNRQWLHLLSRSGSPLFISCKPGVLDSVQEEEVKEAFRHASIQNDRMVPLDWLNSMYPSEWMLGDEKIHYDWF